MNLTTKIEALATRIAQEIKLLKFDVSQLQNQSGSGAEAGPGDFIEFMGRTYGIVQSPTGRLWLDRNLGASQVATAIDDEDAYGDLYQWGRFADGHQLRTSGTNETLATSNTPGNGDFILAPDSPWDWCNPHNHNLWQPDSRINLFAPAGWRLPAEEELNAERLIWAEINASGAFNSILKLPSAGVRLPGTGLLNGVGVYAGIWSSTVSSTRSRYFSFNSTSAAIYTGLRAAGYSVRLIKDE